MITSVANTFRALGSFSKSNEITLFRNLALSIEKHSPSTFIDETHGGKVCNVSFRSVVGKTEICEIADFLIISIGPADLYRATFWQAKKQVASKWLGASLGNEQLDFDGQFNQWDLLFRRPDIKGVGSFHPPSDLLSSFDSAAIGSFGIFYQRGSLIQVCHSTAEVVSCHNPTVKKPKMTTNGYLQKYRHPQGEILTAPTLEAFLHALFAAQVGARLDPRRPADRWLIQYVRKKLANAEGSEDRLVPLDRFFNDKPPTLDIDQGSKGDGLSVLLVRGEITG